MAVLEITIDISRYKRRTDGNLEYTTTAGKTVTVPRTATGNRYARWVHTLDGEGVCPVCAPLIGTVVNLSDPTIRKPPLHPHCRCRTVPIAVDAASRAEGPGQKLQYAEKMILEWLETRSRAIKLSELGRVRLSLLDSGALGLDELYADGRLLTLRELGYDELGRPIAVIPGGGVRRTLEPVIVIPVVQSGS